MESEGGREMFEPELRIVTFITGNVPRRKPIALPSSIGLPKGARLIGAKVAPLRQSPSLGDHLRGATLVNPPQLKRARKTPAGAWAAITLPFKVRTGDAIELAYTVPPTMPGSVTQQGVTAQTFVRFATNATVPAGGYVFSKEIGE